MNENRFLKIELRKNQELLWIKMGVLCALQNKDLGPLRTYLSRAIGDRLYEIIIGKNIINDINSLDNKKLNETVKDQIAELPDTKETSNILEKEVQQMLQEIVAQHGTRLQKLIKYTNDTEIFFSENMPRNKERSDRHQKITKELE